MGIIMYFTFIKMAIIFLAFRFLIVDIYTAFISFYGNFCSNLLNAGGKHLCVITVSAYNLKAASNQTQLNLLDYISFGYVVFCIIFFIVFRKMVIRQQDRYITFPFFHDSYYSILIEDISPFIWNSETKDEEVSYQY